MSSLVGADVPRSDAESKVHGEALYGVDHGEAAMLHAKLLRSPLPAGTVRKLDAGAAHALAGVHAVVTAADAPVARAGPVVADQPLFAGSIVRYEGEPIAGVVAETEDIAREALRRIVVEIDPLPAVGDVEHALQPGAPLVHPEWRAYECSMEFPRAGNVACETTSDPDPEAVAQAFREAAVVVEGEYLAQRQYQAYLEPKSALARWEGGRYVVHTASQFPFNVRDQVARFLGVRSSDVRVIGHHVGGGFGAKLAPRPPGTRCRTRWGGR